MSVADSGNVRVEPDTIGFGARLRAHIEGDLAGAASQSPSSFKKWLARREGDGTAVGDIARDVASDDCLDRMERVTVLTVYRHMTRDHGASPEAVGALGQAWREYAEQVGGAHVDAKEEQL